MSEKHLVCHGAICQCNFGVMPDKLSVKTHQKEYINDADGSVKLIATDKDIAKPFEKNNFGPCAKLNNNPCQVVVTEWKGYYEKTILANGGKILLEDSTATCAIGGSGCIKITFHGQTAEISNVNANNANTEVMAVLNPMVDSDDVKEDDTPDYY